MDNNALLEEFWQSYSSSLPSGGEQSSNRYETWHFCDNEQDANELGALVQASVKTATSSLLWLYEAEGARLPEVGGLSIITNWDGDPLCIIETTEITIHPFNEVDASFAYDEGEGDRSLAYWRTAHWQCFSRELATISREPAEDMPLVCERFRLIWPKP